MDEKDVIAIMTANIYASRAEHKFASRKGMNEALDEARMILKMARDLSDDDLVMRPFEDEN